MSASLTVHAYGGTETDVFLDGRYLAAPWNAAVSASCAGCSDAPVGWRYRDGVSQPWAAPGATEVGADVVAGKAFRLPATGSFATGHQAHEYESPLDPALVQDWLTGENHGLRIVGGVPGVHVGFVQPQRDAAERPTSMRPRLTITVLVP